MDVSEMRPECCVIGLCVYNNEPGLPSVLSNIVKIMFLNDFNSALEMRRKVELYRIKENVDLNAICFKVNK